jgi:hypothetical protein
MLHSFNNQLDIRLRSLGVSPEVKQTLDQQRTKLAAAEIPASLDPGQRLMLKQAVNQSFVAGFRQVVMFCGGLALLSALSAWLLIGGKK